MAYVVGVMLLVLVCVAMPIHYIKDDPRVSNVVSPIHGFLYIVYLLAALDLAIKARWNFWTTVGLLLSGAVPFLSFYMERRVTKQVQERFLQPA
jgi:integral membrane protein